MPLRDEQADILGGPILQRPEAGAFAALSRYHVVFKSVTLFGLGLLLWIVCARGLEHLKKRRELRYRKAMRRKHGIPDTDCRPFAVAYAAAKRARHERVSQDRKTTINHMSDHNSPAVGQRSDAQEDACNLRRRVPETTVQIHDYQLPGKRPVVYDVKHPEVHSTGHHNPDSRRATILGSLPVEGSPVRLANRNVPATDLNDGEEPRKRSLEEESDIEHETVKRSRLDGDEQAFARHRRVPYQGAVGRSLGQQSASGFVPTNGQEISKRADQLRDEDHEFLDEVMEGIDPTEAKDLIVVARGKKRDRAEAGSSFGGDDDDEIRSGRALHHRKRQTISQRIEIPARGQKRDREVESLESENEGADSETSQRRAQHSSKKKRSRKIAADQVTETSVEHPCVSKDPLCGSRSIGDIWEVDGVQYKVGDKGERLRLTLVKKASNKYHMPQDSRHPDRLAALEIYVERWMTDAQYKQAESRQELAWQEALTESRRSKSPDVLDSLTKNGKNLLWDSVKCSPARRPFRQSIPAGAPARINPFQQWQSQPTLGRRVASSSTTVLPILSSIADSPTRPGVRGFSKWEKQDREAEAMTRIRAKIEEQRKAQVPQRPAEIPTSVTALELGTRPLSVPTITLTPAPATAAEKSDDTILQSKPKITTFSFVAPSSTSDSIKRSTATTSTTTPGLSLPSTSVLAASPPTLPIPSAPAATAISMDPTSPFSFTKLQQVPSSISMAGVSPKMPSIFGKGM